MNAAVLILLILLFIGAGLAVYYAVICMQSRPKEDKTPNEHHHHLDRRPLINANDQDLNGNNEDPNRIRPIDEPDSGPSKQNGESGPTNQSPNANNENGLEPPLKSVSFQPMPECASKDPKESSVVLPIDDEPTLNSTKPLIQHLDAPMKAARTPNRMQPQQHPSQRQPQPLPHKEPHHIVPMPMIVSDVPLKAMSVSYEEDGLLVPGSPTHNIAQEEPQKLPESVLKERNPHPHPQTHPKMSTPKHVQFIAPFVNPSFVVDACNPYYGNAQPVDNKPKEEEKPALATGTKHKADENSGNNGPSKKVKLGPQEDATPNQTVPSVKPKEERVSPPTIIAITSEEVENVVPSLNKTPENDKAEEIETLPEDVETPSPLIGWCIPPINKENFDPANESIHSSRDEGMGRSGHLALIREVDEQEADANEPNPSTDDAQPNTTNLSSDPSNPIENENCPVSVVVTFPSESEDRSETSSPDSEKDTESDTSDPDVTEYSFQSDSPYLSSTIDILSNEVSCYTDEKEVGLTNYVSISVSPSPITNREKRPSNTEGHPPTPTSSDTTKSPSPPPSSSDTSLDDITPPINPNVLSTPPTTPPEGKNSPSFIIGNPSVQMNSNSLPTYIVIEPHDSRPRSDSSSSSDTDSSSSSSDGSYKIDGVKEVREDEMDAATLVMKGDKKPPLTVTPPQ